MATFVLVHGSFHGAWCWTKLVPELQRLGHRAAAFDLPALGEDQTPVGEVTLDMNVDRVDEVIGQQAEPVILVGHSLGGATITAAAERSPDKIARLAYLTAFIPRDGESINDITSSPLWPPETGARAFIRSADGLTISASPEGVRDRFYHDCSDEDVAYCMQHLRPQPLVIRTTPIRTTLERFGKVPRAYIHCDDDRSLLPSLQREFVARMPCDRVVALPTSHSPFLSAPAELAKALSDIAAP
jgi:pimeloyl-ACP methyl ester carboxylesterase